MSDAEEKTQSENNQLVETPVKGVSDRGLGGVVKLFISLYSMQIFSLCIPQKWTQVFCVNKMIFNWDRFSV